MSTLKAVVLISGKVGSGKTTLADALDAHWGDRSFQQKFAGPMYEMHEAIRAVAATLGIPFEDKERVLLQVLGTDWGRKVKGEDVWVKAIERSIWTLDASAEWSPEFIVIDDWRFPNEAGVLNLPGDARLIRIRLEAPVQVRRARALSAGGPGAWREGPEHASEKALDLYKKFDLTLYTHNLSTADALRRVLSLVEEKLSG